MREKNHQDWEWKDVWKAIGRFIWGFLGFIGAIATILSFFTNQKTAYDIIGGGVAMNLTPWILLAVTCFCFFRFRKSRPGREVIYLVKIPREAPVLSFLICFIFVCVFCWGEGHSLRNSRLTAQLEMATNPPAVFYNTNSAQIVLTDADFNKISENAKQFAQEFTKKNGYKPKIVISLWSTSKNSNRLVRQIRDAAKGWNVEIHSDVVRNTPTPGIWIYSHDSSTAHPSTIFTFWLTNLNDIPIDAKGGEIDSDLDNSGASIVINDPLYYP